MDLCCVICCLVDKKVSYWENFPRARVCQDQLRVCVQPSRFSCRLDSNSRPIHIVFHLCHLNDWIIGASPPAVCWICSVVSFLILQSLFGYEIDSSLQSLLKDKSKRYCWPPHPPRAHRILFRRIFFKKSIFLAKALSWFFWCVINFKYIQSRRVLWWVCNPRIYQRISRIFMVFWTTQILMLYLRCALNTELPSKHRQRIAVHPGRASLL